MMSGNSSAKNFRTKLECIIRSYKDHINQTRDIMGDEYIKDMTNTLWHYENTLRTFDLTMGEL